jgi:integrase
MASLVKPFVVYWADKQGSKVPKGTPGAKRVKERATKWYGQYKDPQTGKWKRTPLFTDKEASRQELAKLVKALERGQTDLTDPHALTKTLPALDAMRSYLEELKQKGRSERYIYQQRVKLERLFRDTGIDTLAQLTPDLLDGYLNGLLGSARTKNTYRQVCIGMVNFFVKKDKLASNPLMKTTRAEGEQKRRRRALPPEQLQRLLDAAKTRPLDEARIIRRGPRKGQALAAVKPEVQAKLSRFGRHRALLYLTATLTGLRLGTLRQMAVCHLDFGDRPAVRLPSTIMKGGRDFAQLLRPDLVEQLRMWVTDTGRKPTDKVFDVPNGVQVSKVLRKDLRKAGIPYRDEKGRYFDFHSFRKCTATFLRQAGVDPSVSMKHLDHKDIRLTMQVYNDDSLVDQSAALAAMPRLKI